MKKMYFLLIIIAGFSFMSLSSATAEDEKYYYAFEEKISLIPKENTLLIKYVDGFDKTEAEKLIKSVVPSDFSEKWHNAQTVEIILDSEKTVNDLKTKLEVSNEVYICQHFYTLKDGLDMGVSDEILIRFLPGISGKQKEELFKSFEVEVVKTTKIYQKLKVKKGADALEIANKIYESGVVEFSTPSFISYVGFDQIIPNDTYFNSQIACYNTGQIFTDGHSGTADADIDAAEAWAITTGSNNIVIAIIDQGVTSNHPDLPNSRQVRLNGSNFGTGDANDPSPTGNNNHGNACAGVIAATMNNNQGIAGIASECMIMPIRCDNTTMPPDMADAIEFAVDNGADILSNSWSYASPDQELHPVIVTAINYALGHNCVVIFSAGNNANNFSCDYDGYVEFPANVNIPGIITVGASDRNDNQADYSPTSSLIDIVAPSSKAKPPEYYYPFCGGINGETDEMWSIDIPGNAGYNPWPANGTHPPATGEILPNTGTNNLAYTARFGGTSHSCPVVAGVVALILSVNPDLSYTDVFNIVTSTANKVGGYTYTNGKCNEMGYGRVNAYAAVLASFRITGPTTLCSSGGSYSISNVPSGATITWSCGPEIQRQSAQGANPCTFRSISDGDSYVQATITYNGQTIALPGFNVYSGLPPAPPDRYAANVDGYDGYYTKILNSGTAYFTMTNTSSFGKWWDTQWATSTTHGGNDYYLDIDADVLGTNYVLPYWTNACGISEPGPSVILEVVLGKSANQEEISFGLSPNPAEQYVDIKLNLPSGMEAVGTYWAEFVNPYSVVAKEVELDGPENRVGVADLPKGYYVVKLRIGKEIYTNKLVIE